MARTVKKPEKITKSKGKSILAKKTEANSQKSPENAPEPPRNQDSGSDSEDSESSGFLTHASSALAQNNSAASKSPVENKETAKENPPKPEKTPVQTRNGGLKRNPDLPKIHQFTYSKTSFFTISPWNRHEHECQRHSIQIHGFDGFTRSVWSLHCSTFWRLCIMFDSFKTSHYYAKRHEFGPKNPWRNLNHTVRKSQIMSENSIFRKIQNSEFRAEKPWLLRIYLYNLNFSAENRDFNQKQNFQKLKIIEFRQFLARKFKNRKSQEIIIFCSKIRIHNFVIFFWKLIFGQNLRFSNSVLPIVIGKF